MIAIWEVKVASRAQSQLDVEKPYRVEDILNKCISSFFLKQARLRFGSRKTTERLFQAVGELTANAHGPTVTVLVLGTHNWLVAADRRLDRPSIAPTGIK